jgi:hypothetical protein
LVERAITKIAKDIGGDEALSPFRELLDVVREINMRLQDVERKMGYSDSFVNPNDANNKISNA